MASGKKCTWKSIWRKWETIGPACIPSAFATTERILYRMRWSYRYVGTADARVFCYQPRVTTTTAAKTGRKEEYNRHFYTSARTGKHILCRDIHLLIRQSSYVQTFIYERDVGTFFRVAQNANKKHIFFLLFFFFFCTRENKTVFIDGRTFFFFRKFRWEWHFFLRWNGALEQKWQRFCLFSWI